MITAPQRYSTHRITTRRNAPTFPPIRRRDGRKTIQSRFAPQRAPRTARPRPTLATSTPEPEPRPLTIEEQDAIILEKLARIEAQAMKLLSRRESAATVSGLLKIPLREAFRLQAMHREQQKEAA